MKKKYNGTCLYCGKPFEAISSKKKYCSDGCRVMAYKKRNNIPMPDFLPKKVVKRVQTRLEIELNAKIKLFHQKEQEIKLLRTPKGMQRELKQFDIVIYKLQNKRRELQMSKPYKPTDNSDALFHNRDTTPLSGNTFRRYEYNIKKKEEMEEYNIKNEKINLEVLKIEEEIKYYKNKQGLTDKILDKAYNEFESLRTEIEAMQQGYRLDENLTNGRTTTSADLMNVKFETYKVSNSYENVFGEPAKDFIGMIHGTAGGGKSSFLIKFADYFVNNHGTVCFFSIEEKTSKSFADKLKRNTTGKKPIVISLENKPLKIKKMSQDYDLCIIDSVTDANFSIEDIHLIVSASLSTQTSFLFVVQDTKDGKYKGTAELGHKMDIILNASEGMVTVEKTRYKIEGIENETYKIY